jgi:hypothetical protein
MALSVISLLRKDCLLSGRSGLNARHEGLSAASGHGSAFLPKDFICGLTGFCFLVLDLFFSM